MGLSCNPSFIQFGIHDTSMKPITTESLDRRRNRHKSSVAFVNGGTLKKKLDFGKFFLLPPNNYTFPIKNNNGYK